MSLDHPRPFRAAPLELRAVFGSIAICMPVLRTCTAERIERIELSSFMVPTHAKSERRLSINPRIPLGIRLPMKIPAGEGELPRPPSKSQFYQATAWM